MIKSRKVYLPVALKDKSRNENVHDGTEHGTNPSLPWQLATISPTSVELTCAQTIYSEFLDALFSSSRVGEIQQTLGGLIRIESSRHHKTLDYNGFTLPEFHLRNDGIDTLVHIIGESGLYDNPMAAELRIMSALLNADLLPVATETILA